MTAPAIASAKHACKWAETIRCLGAHHASTMHYVLPKLVLIKYSCIYLLVGIYATEINRGSFKSNLF